MIFHKLCRIGATALVMGSLGVAAVAQEVEGLKIYFPTGSAAIPAEEQATLDQAARTFREGSPYVMILSGGADTVGEASRNLDLSVRRARSVADGLVARGIPISRLQVLGRGVTDPLVETGAGVSEEENRVVEITWR